MKPTNLIAYAMYGVAALAILTVIAMTGLLVHTQVTDREIRDLQYKAINQALEDSQGGAHGEKLKALVESSMKDGKVLESEYSKIEPLIDDVNKELLKQTLSSTQ